MNRIKIVGGFITFILIILFFLSNYIATQNSLHNSTIKHLNEQKALTQEISKSIFYMDKKRDISSVQAKEIIDRFINSIKSQKIYLAGNYTIISLWSAFESEVKKLKNQYYITTPYGSIITDKIVNRIYTINLQLVVAFDELIDREQIKYQQDIEQYKNLQYLLFGILILLLLYFFSQIQEVIIFIQKFSTISKKILSNATIQGVEPIELKKSKSELKEATQNYNHLVQKINNSITYATKSIEHTTQSLEEVEQNIENFIKLISTMQEKNDNELFEKEDAVIESLETLINLKNRLKDLKKNLENLVK
ncbi:MAG: hypothetical protein KAU90_02235 [Sulfurovaceae bacterium]|nr:hypothetical protein [Sulfurovaceae bacterium]